LLDQASVDLIDIVVNSPRTWAMSGPGPLLRTSNVKATVDRLATYAAGGAAAFASMTHRIWVGICAISRVRLARSYLVRCPLSKWRPQPTCWMNRARHCPWRAPETRARPRSPIWRWKHGEVRTRGVHGLHSAKRTFTQLNYSVPASTAAREFRWVQKDRSCDEASGLTASARDRRQRSCS